MKKTLSNSNQHLAPSLAGKFLIDRGGPGRGFEMKMEHFHIINSTQTYIKESKLALLRENSESHQLIVVSAEHQTHGRGKGARKWFSDESSKCLALSFGFLVPPVCLKNSAILTQLLALAVIETFPDLEVLMKWPNDLLIGGKKIGGILAELEPIGDNDDYAVIIGVGLNLDIDQSCLDSLQSRWPASSVSRFLPAHMSIDFYETRDKIIANFSRFLSIFLQQNPQQLSHLMTDISLRQFLFNQPILFRDGDKSIRGVHAGIDPTSGGLKIFSPDDSVESTFYSGEIVIESVF